MLNHNIRLKNIPSRGNTLEFIKHQKEILETNDGTRSFNISVADCDNNPCPLNKNKKTIIPMTSPDHMITDFNKSFYSLIVELTLHATGIDPNLEDVHKLLKIFVGLKSSNQIIDRLKILCRGLQTDYNSSECVREGFAFSNTQDYASKKTKKFAESLYENVSIQSQSVAGYYINAVDYKDGKDHIAQFELIIPYDHLLPFQEFDMICNRVVGELSNEIFFTEKGLVYCMVDPRQVRENQIIMEGTNITDTITDSTVFFKRDFTQINNSANIINKATTTEGKIAYEHGEVSLICTNIRILEFKANRYGFGITEQTLKGIAELYAQGIPILTQQLKYVSPNSAPTANGINTTINQPLINATELSVMFPKNANDITVFENPMYKDVQLKIGNTNYPSEPIQTQGARFLQMQLIASELDGALQCTQEFEDSLTLSKNTLDGTRYKNTIRDSTSFMLNYTLERPGANHCFDGLYYPNGVPIQFRGSPIFNGKNDTYYNVDDAGTIHPPSIEYWICEDVWFELSDKGFRYIYDSEPNGSQQEDFQNA